MGNPTIVQVILRAPIVLQGLSESELSSVKGFGIIFQGAIPTLVQAMSGLRVHGFRLRVSVKVLSLGLRTGD